MSAVLARLQHEPDPWHEHAIDPYRACTLCDHGAHDLAGTRCCISPLVAARGQVVHVAKARQRGGACGPEAEHLDFPGLRR